MARNIVPWAPKLAQVSSKAKYRAPRVVPVTTKNLVWFVWGGFLVLFAGDVVLGEKGLLQARAVEARLAETSRTKAGLERELDRLNRDLAVRESDPRSFEKPAREKYRMIKEGERLYLFEDDNVVPAGPWDEAFTEDPPAGN